MGGFFFEKEIKRLVFINVSNYELQENDNTYI
jgi:hypothetical protein